MLDPYWDNPEYTSTSLLRLHADRNKAANDVTLYKKLQNETWVEEQRLLAELKKIRAEALRLVNAKEESEKAYNRLSSIEIDFAEQVRIALELANIENKISALELRLHDISKEHAFWNAIMPFQKEDLLYMINAWDMGMSGVLNANAMGLGKTFETVSFDFLACKMFEEKHGTSPKRIWVTKKSLVKSTVRELRKWFPDVSVIPLMGTTAEKQVLLDISLQMGGMIVTNYETLVSLPSITEMHWDFIYADEVHRLKGGSNPTPTKLWLGMRDLIFKSREKGSFFIPLSGSPIQNHPKEMWSYLHLFDPVRFPDVKKFERNFCSWWSAGFRVDFDVLIKSMKSQVIRHTMDEVKGQLSQVLHEPILDVREIELTPSQQKAYDQMRDEFFLWLDNEQEEGIISATVIIAQLNRLRQINVWPDSIVNRPIGSAKIDETMDLIEELTGQDEQVVIFSSQFNDPLFEIERRCKEFYELPVGLITGSTKDVDFICEEFRQGRIKVLCVNAKSGGEGLNLQKSVNWPGGASHVIMLDKWWNPEFNKQAISRVYRTGQTDIVTIHELYAVNTVDAYIEKILSDKTDMIGSIMESTELRKNGRNWKETLRDVI